MTSCYIMYTDGGSRGNPGPAGIGVAILDSAEQVIATVSDHIGEQTNNWAEYEAVIRGLKKLKSVLGKGNTKEAEIEIRMDSELVTKQLRGEYQIKEESLFPQYIAVHNLIVAHFPNVTFAHVPREKNKQADGLANDAMDLGAQESLL